MNRQAAGRNMRITIKDVAQMAGVSPSTVSRVLAKDPRISPVTAEKVRQAIQATHYHPNGIARSLVRKASLTIGFSVAQPADQAFASPFVAEALRGAATVAQRNGYYLMIFTAPTLAEERHHSLTLYREGRIDGVILTTARVHDTLLDDLRKEGLPFAVIGRPTGRQVTYWVNNDNVGDAKAATEHLLRLGHRRIGLITGPRQFVVTQDRTRGFRLAMEEAGASPRLLPHAAGPFTEQGGYQAAAEIIRRQPDITALLVTDDVMAVGALRALADAGRRVPEDVAVMCFNDSPLASAAHPPLSAVRIPMYELGARATELLIAVLEGHPPWPGHILLPADMVLRASTGEPAGDAPATAGTVTAGAAGSTAKIPEAAR